MKEARFAVVIRFDSYETPGAFVQNVRPPLVYWHRTPGAAARRLTALINQRAAWVPNEAKSGTRFYIVDHADDPTFRKQWPLNAFKTHFGLAKPV